MGSIYPSTKSSGAPGRRRAPRPSGERPVSIPQRIPANDNPMPGIPANDNPMPGIPANDNIKPRLPANDNIRKSLPMNIAKAGLRYAFRRFAWFNPALTALEIAYSLYQHYQNFEGENYDLRGWTQSGTYCGGSQEGISSRGLERPCGSIGVATLSSWLASEGQIKVSAPYGVPARRDYSFSIYKNSKVPDLSWGANYATYYYHSRYLKTVYVTDPAPAKPERERVFKYVPASFPKTEQILVGRLISVMPDAQPILSPALQPQPVPYSDIPNIPLSDFPQSRKVGYSVAFSPGKSQPVELPKVDEYPPYLPPIVVETDNGQKPAEPSPFHKRRPPDSRTKELKARSVSAWRGISRIVNPLTEGVEIVDILYKNIDNAYKPKYKNTPFVKKKVSYPEKLLAIYKNFDHINWGIALRDLTINELEDRVYAFTGKMGGRTSAVLNRPVGTGLNSILGRIPQVKL